MSIDGKKTPAASEPAIMQSQRFIEAARAAGVSEDEAVFDANLKQIAKAKVPASKAEAPPKSGRATRQQP